MTDREDVVLKIPLAEAQEKLSTQIGQAREMLMRSPQNEQQLRTRSVA
jgi:hypothetical protein